MSIDNPQFGANGAAPLPEGMGQQAPDSLALLQAERDRVARELEKVRVAAETAAMREQTEALRRGATAQPVQPDATGQQGVVRGVLGQLSQLGGGLVPQLGQVAGAVTPENLRAGAAALEALQKGGGLPGAVDALKAQGAAEVEVARQKAAQGQPPTFRDRVRDHQQAAAQAGAELKPGDATKAAVLGLLLDAGAGLVRQQLAPQAPTAQPQASRADVAPSGTASVSPARPTQPDGSPAPEWPLPAGMGQPLPPTQPMPGHPQYREPAASNGAVAPQPQQQSTLRYIPNPQQGHSNGGGQK